MRNIKRNAKDQKPRFNPSEHKELVKISGDRILEIQVSKIGSVETRIIDLVKQKN